MFSERLEGIQKRESYINSLTHKESSMIHTKEAFCAALEECPKLYAGNSDYQEDQKIFFSPTSNGPISNLFRHIIPAAQNSYEEIQQLELRLKLFNSDKLEQTKVLKQFFNRQKERIKESGLRTSDFIQIYKKLKVENNQGDMNDLLSKEIKNIFEFSTDSIPICQLLETIIDRLDEENGYQNKQGVEMKEMRKKIFELQGLDSQYDEEGDVNDEARRQIEITEQLLESMVSIFDLQNGYD